MNINCVVFAAANLRQEEIEGKRVIEVGACDVNGSVRGLIAKYKPREYIGVDIQQGRGVDVICDVKTLIQKFGEDSFDAVITTELLEHVRDWKTAIHNLKKICKSDGVILITTRSFGFGYHGFPHDFWRYETEDMSRIFSDCQIEALEKDPQKGVFVKCRKPVNFKENDLSGLELYSIVTSSRMKQLTDKDCRLLRLKLRALKEDTKYYLHKLIDALLPSS